MTERLTCCVLGCRRTTGKPFKEWICAIHWKLISKTTKRRRAKLRRLAKTRGWTFRIERMDNKLWERAKKEANERMMGI